MAELLVKEVSRNFAPTLPKDLEAQRQPISGQKPLEPKGGFLGELTAKAKETVGQAAKKIEGAPLSPQEIQDKTAELYDFLVKRVELRIDLTRHSKGGTPVPDSKSAQQPVKSLQERLDQIKKGDMRAVVAEVTRTDVSQRTVESDLRELREVEEHISELTKYPQVAQQYARLREERVNKLRSAKEATECETAVCQLRLQQEKMARAAFLQGRQYSPGEQRIIDENRQITKALEERADFLKKDPEVFDLARLRELEGYQHGLKTDRFAETPSRGKYIDAVREYWSRGKKVLLTGPTGGGKTELLLHASRGLFGEEAERLTGHELMTNYEVYGKTKGGVKEGQVTLMFGSAPFVRSIERNVPFIFDEINAVPNKILLRLKTDLNARVGQPITIQEDSDKKITVGDRFAVGATENVKSEKHADREKLDPALVRMFEPLPIDYFPPAELYDIMLASLMDVRGGVRLSVKDANDTLRALCDATEWVQKSYLGQTVATAQGQILAARGQESIGKPATLREAVLDPGKALDMLVGWEDAQREGLTFREFLNRRIVAFINNENFPEEDRYYLAEIFALQGFFRGVKVEDLRIAGLDQNTLNAWSGYDGKRYVPKSQYTSAEIVAKLDPYGRLRRPVSAAASDLLDEGETVEEVKEEEPLKTPSASTAIPGAGKGKVSGPTIPIPPAGGPLSIEGKRKLSTIDSIYPASKFAQWANGQARDKLYENYPKALLDLARTDRTTYVGVMNRLAGILDTAEPNAFRLGQFLSALEEFTEMTIQEKQLRPKIAAMVAKIDGFTSWKSGSEVGSINHTLARLEKMLLS